MKMKQKLKIWMMGSSRIVHMSRSWQRSSRQHLEMSHWILCILMLHFEWDHMTINETYLTSFCALRIWGGKFVIKTQMILKTLFLQTVSVHLFEVMIWHTTFSLIQGKSHFPFVFHWENFLKPPQPTDFYHWIKKGKWLLPRMRLIMVYEIITSNRWTLAVCTNTVFKKVKPTFPF